MKNPFNNYRTALIFLKNEIHKKTMLSNFEPSDIEWALWTIFNSKEFNKKFAKRTKEVKK